MIYLDIILMNRDDLNDENSTLSWIGRVLQEVLVITTHSMWYMSQRSCETKQRCEGTESETTLPVGGTRTDSNCEAEF